MDYFEVEEKKEKEALEEKKYQELYAKQAKISKTVMLAVFTPIGLVFILLGIIFMLTLEKEDGIIGGIVFLLLGGFFLIFGLLFYLLIPKKGNYARYKKNIQRFGGLNTYSMLIRIGMLEENVKALEEECEELKRKIKDS